MRYVSVVVTSSVPAEDCGERGVTISSAAANIFSSMHCCCAGSLESIAEAAVVKCWSSVAVQFKSNLPSIITKWRLSYFFLVLFSWDVYLLFWLKHFCILLTTYRDENVLYAWYFPSMHTVHDVKETSESIICWRLKRWTQLSFINVCFSFQFLLQSHFSTLAVWNTSSTNVLVEVWPTLVFPFPFSFFFSQTLILKS